MEALGTLSLLVHQAEPLPPLARWGLMGYLLMLSLAYSRMSSYTALPPFVCRTDWHEAVNPSPSPSPQLSHPELQSVRTFLGVYRQHRQKK